MTLGADGLSQITTLWRHDDFRRLWSAQIVSAVGSRVTRTALPIIAIGSLDASPFVMAMMAILNYAPAPVVGLFFGGAVDRSQKRWLMIAADLFRFAVVLTITIAGFTGHLTITHLGLVAALGATASWLFEIASHAYLPVVVGREQLVDANAKLGATESAAEIVGPALAGVLIDLLTAPIAVLLDALSYLWSAAFLFRVRAREVRPEPTSDPERASWTEGLRLVWRQPILRVLILGNGTWAFFGGFFFSLYMLYTLKVLALSNSTVGFVIAFGGVGALAGALLAKRLIAQFGLGAALVLSWSLCQISALFIPLASIGPTVPLLVAHQLVSDGFMMAAVIMGLSLRQMLMPQTQLGRVSGAFSAVEGTTMPLGIVLSGTIAEFIGVTPAVWIGVLGGLSVPVLLALSPVLHLREMPRTEASS